MAHNIRYSQGNEPNHHVIFLYFLLGEPEKGNRYLDQAMAMFVALSLLIRFRPDPSSN